MKLHFYLRFHTKFGQVLSVVGNIEELGNNDPVKAVQMNYLNKEYWELPVEITQKPPSKSIIYKYILKNEDGTILQEWGHDRTIEWKKILKSVQLIDIWNHAGEFENAFFTAPFDKVLLKANHSKSKASSDRHYTHVFRVKAPLLKKNEIICILGNAKKLNAWNEDEPLLLSKAGNWWSVNIDLSEANIPIGYKYGVYNSKEKSLTRFEEGDNRLLQNEIVEGELTIIHDGFVHLANQTWKGAGVAIPVFSLRSKNSFGVGEFADIKLLADWAKQTGLKLIQLLPVNDTMACFTWRDSYPYSAISAFALHPLYLNLAIVAGKDHAKMIGSLKTKQKQLNGAPNVEYGEVMKFKYSVLAELYEVMGAACFESDDYKEFFESNKHWLEPYACFCFYRDKYGTAVFDEWKTNKVYNSRDAARLCAPSSTHYKKVGFYYFMQYHLHLQLKDAADYAHKKGVVLKGDIPIGISRYSCDAWVAPQMYHMQWQAGAPPDDFTAVGQNWGFPTYNWKRMQEDGFAWWKQRFEQMSNYFDAFRIDHILGFFRIWSIPLNSVQGIMGRFVPCLPVHIIEFGQNSIWMDYQRFCRPYITDDLINDLFPENANEVKEKFLVPNNYHGYDMNVEFETQKQVEKYFEGLEETTENERLKLGLFDLISNVILFEENDSNGEWFHFRISMEKTHSFLNLIPHIQEKLNGIYINYFYRRQDDFWGKEALNKLPQLKAATNMLVCGEDLGMVPHCVPSIMQQLGILSLEIQRMPKDPAKEFFYPAEAPYMSVITPSTHDMSTIRGWWEENRERTQHFYNNVLGQWGDAPAYCEAWINRAVVLQHLYSPAMWSVFMMQDILGMSETIRRENPHDERINNPANPKNYWQYRMHISLEDLIKEKTFNEELEGYITNSGR